MSYTDDIRNAASLMLPWEKLDGCKILIAGATGLIGSCLTEVLMARKDRNYHVSALGRNEHRMSSLYGKYADEQGFQLLRGDVTKPLALDGDYDYIIHAASGAAPAEFMSHPVEVMQANINGVSNLLEYGLQHRMKRLLYVSSGEVYGEGDGRVFTEDYSGYVDCSSPRSCYPSSKRAAETICACYAAEYGADVVIARPCHTYGPNFTENDNRVYAQFIRNVLRGEDIVLKSSGEQIRSWCYVVDCVSALLYILLKGERGEAYNIADAGSNRSIRDLAEMIASTGQRRIVFDIPTDAEKLGFNPVTKSLFSTEKIESLGWVVKGGMREKLEATIRHLRK